MSPPTTSQDRNPSMPMGQAWDPCWCIPRRCSRSAVGLWPMASSMSGAQKAACTSITQAFSVPLKVSTLPGSMLLAVPLLSLLGGGQDIGKRDGRSPGVSTLLLLQLCGLCGLASHPVSHLISHLILRFCLARALQTGDDQEVPCRPQTSMLHARAAGAWGQRCSALHLQWQAS